jgi:hypothetical protein
MVVLQNSNVLKHGTLWPIIHDLLFVTKDYKVSKCVGIISPLVMVKVKSMGVGALLKREICKEQIKAQTQRLQDIHDVV